jgi:rhodanese-related sulfurtransferase
MAMPASPSRQAGLYKRHAVAIVGNQGPCKLPLGINAMKTILMIILTAFSTLFPMQGWAEAVKDAVILDVRTPEEFKETRVKGAVNIDFKNPNFKSEIEKLDKNKPYKLYCRSGNRSGKAMELMKGMGFTNLENLGSVKEAAEKLKIACEGEKPC